MTSKGNQPMNHHVSLSIDSRGVAVLCIRNAGPLNILGTEVVSDVLAALNAISSNEAVRVVVLSTSGSKAFIGGADIKEMVDFDAQEGRRFISSLRDLCVALRQYRVPVVARVQGWCLGGGLEVAAACDIRVAAGNARFAMPEVRMGIPSVIHAALLPALIGSGRARWLMLSAEAIDAQTALAWGLVTDLADDAELDQAVERVLEPLLQIQPGVMVAQKCLLNDWEGYALGDAIDSSIPCFGDAFDTGEPGRSMREFISRRRG